MLVSNLLFDGLLFSALLLAALLDSFVPALHGAASLLVMGGITYIAAQEWHNSAQRNGWWSQESLCTAVALSTGGFLYFWFRNQSDLALLALSIGLMMASLMVAIAFIAALGNSWHKHTPAPLLGFLLSCLGALLLGALAAFLALALGRDPAHLPVAIKIVLLIAALGFWKLREKVRPLPSNAAPMETSARPLNTPAASPVAHDDALLSAGAARPALIPQRGSLLDRLIPALLLGTLLFLNSSRAINSFAPLAPAATASTPQGDTQP